MIPESCIVKSERVDVLSESESLPKGPIYTCLSSEVYRQRECSFSKGGSDGTLDLPQEVSMFHQCSKSDSSRGG